jgi:predicted MPP superfamily phosphohydrolase
MYLGLKGKRVLVTAGASGIGQVTARSFAAGVREQGVHLGARVGLDRVGHLAAGDPLEACIRQLARVKADAGMFGCLGNHERYARAESEAARVAAQSGIPILRGQAQLVRWGNSVLNVAGVDYQRGSSKGNYLLGAQRLVYPEGFNLLLSHNPDVFPVAARQGYDLVLAGHTHGGQVNIEILDESINPARFYTPYIRGLYRLRPEDTSAAAYVTPGIGTIGIPARIGAPPEISLLTLRKA